MNLTIYMSILLQVLEITKGSNVKYEIDKKTGLWTVKVCSVCKIYWSPLPVSRQWIDPIFINYTCVRDDMMKSIHQQNAPLLLCLHSRTLSLHQLPRIHGILNALIKNKHMLIGFLVHRPWGSCFVQCFKCAILLPWDWILIQKDWQLNIIVS